MGLALRRALAKRHPRVVAVDDGAFRRRARTAPIAAVVVVLPEQLEAVRLGAVRVDGDDATDRTIELARRTGALDGVRAMLVDGAVLGGFNVLDLDRLHRALGVPVIAVTRRRPDWDRIRAALAKWFPRDGAARWRRLRRHRLFPVPTKGAPIYASAVGCRKADATALVQRSAIRGFWPEPLRLAHQIASAGSRTRAGAKD